jgi:DNA processing protein
MTDTIDRLRLIRTESVGPITYRRLIARFRTPQAALAAVPELAATGGRTAKLVIPSRAEAERELAALAKIGAKLVFLDEPGYPPFLAQLADAPPALCVLGDVSLLAARSVGIVGARNATANGMRLAQDIAADLGTAQLTVISGLARGIDAAAHQGAMHTGRTIAVIAGGLDLPYPPENEKLQAQIATNGAVVAEAPLGTAPQARHFPKRNRIIAGLVLGLVVIEAAQRSGSLLTARMANDANRELFAVPGSPLDPRSKGANDLIRQGAHLTESAVDILANLPDHPSRSGIARDPLFQHGQPGFAERSPLWDETATDRADLAQARRKIPNLIGADPVAVDEIARRCQLSTAAVMAVVLELELGGRVQTLPGNRVVTHDGNAF